MKIPDYNKKIKHSTYLEMQEEIERLTFESTNWESKFYDEAKKVDKAIEYIKNNYPVCAGVDLLKILSGEDNENIRL